MQCNESIYESSDTLVVMMMVMIMIKYERRRRTGVEEERKGLGEGERGRNYGNRNMSHWKILLLTKYLREWGNTYKIFR